MMTENTLNLLIADEQAGQRLDQALAALLPDYSRSQLQAWIQAGQVQVNGAMPRQRDRMAGGEQVIIRVPEAPDNGWKAQAIPLNIVYEDEALLVLDKPAGLVVHPGSGNPEGTLLNALLNHAPQLQGLARAGIVHRLDKDTSGLLVVAKTDRARLDLIEQLQTRSLSREYQAVVNGILIAGGTVEASIGRHHRDRKRMAVTSRGKPAVTHYRVKQRYRAHTLLLLKLETGRTHQIRVHMAHIHHPIVGDPVYGGRLKIPAGCSEALRQALHGFRRQALHAFRLGIVHPLSGETLSWESPLPDDVRQLLQILKDDLPASAG